MACSDSICLVETVNTVTAWTLPSHTYESQAKYPLYMYGYKNLPYLVLKFCLNSAV